MFKHIFFDFDGTVFDTVEGISKSAQYAAAKQGIELPLEEFRCFAGPPLFEMFMEKFDLDAERAQKCVDDFVERYLPTGVHECRIFPGVENVIRNVRACGKRTGIATSKPYDLAKFLLEKEGIYDLFDTVRGSAKECSNAPKWRILQDAMADLGADETNSVLVGDTKWDVFGAHKIGVRCVGVRYGYAAKGELEEAGADYIVNDLAELEKFLFEH